MNLKQIICSPKSDIKIGEWRKGLIPRADFPLSRAKPKDYKVSDAYDWCIIRFSCLGLDCRVRVLLREGREIFYATLGVVEGGDTKIVCSYEFHGTEPGWHCHVKCDELANVRPGQNRYGAVRLPNGRRKHRRDSFGVSKTNAKHKAIDFYRIEERGGLL